MGVIIPQVITEDRASSALVVDGSLVFETTKKDHLEKTLSQIGNRRIWTWSAWVKPAKSGAINRMWGVYADANNQNGIQFNGDSKLEVFDYGSGAYKYLYITSSVFRDTEWYHLVVSVDTTIPSIKIYKNGEQIENFSTATNPTTDLDTQIGNNYQTEGIGSLGTYDGEYFNGSQSNVYFIDGQALGPEYFGYTDPLTNTWRPKKLEFEKRSFTNPRWYSSATLYTTTADVIANATDRGNGGVTVTNEYLYLVFNDGGYAHTGGINNAPDYPVWSDFGTFNEVTRVFYYNSSAWVNAASYGTAASEWNQWRYSNSASYGAYRIGKDFAIDEKMLVFCDNNDSASPSTAGKLASATLPTFNTDAFHVQNAIKDTWYTGGNSYHLPFDGNSPIGQDKFDTKNDWTPVNFGCSAALDKATGALPILNTVNGGNIAAPGVLGSKVSKYYTLTGSSGAGSGYVFENEGTKPTLEFHRGGTYTFDYTSATSHPFYLSSLSDGKHNSKAYSVDFNGTSQYLSVPASSDFDFGSGDFTVEWFQWWDDTPATYESPFSINYATNTNLLVQSGNGTTAYTVYMNGTSTTITESSSGPTGEWVHYAVVRSGSASNNVKIYRNGAVSGQGTYTGNVGNSSVPLYIGYDENYYFDGKISNFRVVKGTAVYTGSFNPPSTTLTNISGTVLLCCQDSAATTAEVIPTGSITASGSVIASNAYNPFLYSVDNYFGVDTSTSNVTKMTVPNWAADTLYYYCSVHSGMGNSISVVTDTNKADPYAWKNTLALPLVGVKSDFSNSVNSGSTTKTVTATNAVASSAQSNFYGGSWYFDGTGDYVTVTDNADFNFGSDDFTIEFWSYATAVGTFISWGQDVSNRVDIGPRASFGSGGYRVLVALTGESTITPSTDSYPSDKWVHNAIVRSGNTIYIYLDGVMSGSGAWTAAMPTPSATGIRIGGRDYGSGLTDYMTGYIQDLRIYKGIAKYTSNFIPASTNPDILPDTPSGVSGSSKLTKITDGAVYFDGTGDYLDVSESSGEFDFGTGDFTVEFFANADLYGYDIIGTSNNTSYLGASKSGWIIRNVSNEWYFSYQSNSSWIFQTTFSTNAAPKRWHHVAFTRSGTDLKCFMDGIQQGSTSTNSTNLISTENSLRIGGGTGSTSNLYRGFLSNVRIIKGTALYTSNFTPPTRALTNVTNTKLLCCQSPSDNATTVGTMYKSTTLYTTKADIIANATVVANGGSLGGSDYFYFVPNGNEPIGGTIFSGDGSITNSDSLNRWEWYWYNGSGWTQTSGGYNNTNWTTFVFGDDTTAYQLLPSRDFYALGVFSVTDPGVHGGTAPSLGSHSTLNAAVSPSGIARNGDASATNFNPFTTDINTVRGQESGYATWNPLVVKTNNSLSNGNLTASHTASTGWTGGVWNANSATIVANTGVSSGSWYWEVHIDSESAPGYTAVGITTRPVGGPYYVGYADNGIAYTSTYIYQDSAYGSGTGSLPTTASGDTIGVALDMDNGHIWFSKNGIYVYGNPYTRTGSQSSNIIGTMYPAVSQLGSATGFTATANFGQKPFKFPPPEGFQPLNAANARPSTVITRPDQYVGVSTFSGTATSNVGAGLTQTISGFRFSPDLIWVKARTKTATINSYVNEGYHVLVDTVRGRDKILSPNDTGSELTNAYTIPSINRDGFDVGYEPSWDLNMSGDDYVAWCWKAGGSSNTFNVDDVGYATASAAGLTAGTKTPTGASVNTKSGLSIIAFTGDETAGTISHGLGKAPSFYIVKTRDSNSGGSNDWYCYHSALGASARIQLNSTAAQTTGSSQWNSTSPTSSVLSLGSGSWQETDDRFIIYAWADVPGLQKFGSYIGNGSADGPFIELGFRPALLIIKQSRSNGDGWYIYDTQRNKYNPTNNYIWTQDVYGDQTSGNIDILSNGFKIRTTASSLNYGAVLTTYIYAAWAEAPSFNLYGAQSNAR